MIQQPDAAGRLRLRTAMVSGVAAAVSVAGAVMLLFAGVSAMTEGAVMEGFPVGLAVPSVILGVAMPFLAGGLLWGWVLAALFGGPRWRAARTGALSLTGMVLLLEAPVHMSQALPLSDWFPFGLHGAFTVIFALETYLVSRVVSGRMVRRLGFGGMSKTLGKQVGLVGAGGFVLGSLLAWGLGFEVGSWPPANMVWALHVANVVAAFSAGWYLGWRLADSNASSALDRSGSWNDSTPEVGSSRHRRFPDS